MKTTTFYNLKDLEKVLGVKVRKIREYIKKRELGASKVGRQYIVTDDDVREFVERRRV